MSEINYNKINNFIKKINKKTIGGNTITTNNNSSTEGGTPSTYKYIIFIIVIICIFLLFLRVRLHVRCARGGALERRAGWVHCRQEGILQ
jgi:hypothetical protein